MRSTSLPTSALRVIVAVSAVLSAFAASLYSLTTALQDMTDLIRGPGRASVDELVIAVSAAGALVLLLWVALGLLASVLAALPGPLGALGRRARDSIAPQAVRRCAALLLGVAVVSACGPGGAAAAELGTVPAEVGTVRALDDDAGSPAPAPLWVAPAPLWAPPSLAPRPADVAVAAVPAAESSPQPERAAPLPPAPTPAPALPPAPAWTPAPVRALPPVTLTAPRPTADSQRPEVTVHRGDTLWDLAAAHLSPEATDAEIAASWHRWWADNRDIIGADPDHILPGQVLSVPTAAAVLAGGSR